MIFGAITNSWKIQLESIDLRDLVIDAERRGATHIELRQTCLGEYETGEGDGWRPMLPHLRTLTEDFQGLSFNLAMVWPCLTEKSDPEGEPFQAALEGAKAVGRSEPHLRIVDPSRFEAPWDSASDIPEEALAIADLAMEAARHGVVLSMENSGLPIRSMAMLVEGARARMGRSEANYLGLCPDPTNQLRSYPATDPLDDLDAVPLDMIKIVHFKQLRGGQPYHSVGTGDLDCGRMLSILQAKGFPGPAIMEIPPDPRVFDNLESSFAFLRSELG